MQRSLPCILALIASLPLLSSCGYVAIGAATGGGGGGGGGGAAAAPNTAPQVDVTTPADQAAGVIALSFRVTDSEASLTDASVEFSFAGGAFSACTANSTSLPLSTLTTAASGRDQLFSWDAAADLGASLEQLDVRLRVTVRDAIDANLEDSETTASFRLGNTPPVLSDITVNGSGGNVVVRYKAADAASDISSLTDGGLRPEYSTDGGVSFRDIDPAAIVGGNVNRLAPKPDGADKDFTWNTNARLGAQGSAIQEDLADRISQVILRLTPSDAPFGATQLGAPVVSPPFTVTNNSPPLVTLLEPILTVDSGGAMMLEVTVFDAQSDPVDLEIQLARQTPFPTLPAGRLTATRQTLTGRARSLNPSAGVVGAPGFLAGIATPSSASHPLIGRRLELLERPGLTPRSPNPAIADPVGILLEPGEQAALICDRGAGSVLRVPLEGGPTSVLTSGLGAPGYLALSDDGATLLVTDEAGGQLHLIARGSGQLQASFGGFTSPRGVTTLSARSALVVDTLAGGRLLRVDLVSGSLTPLPLTLGLSDPRALVVDRSERRAYIACAGDPADPSSQRIVRVALDRGDATELVNAAGDGPPRPAGLALDASGTRLLISTLEGDQSRLVQLDPRLPARGQATFTRELRAPEGLAFGADGHSALALESGSGGAPRRLRFGSGVAASGMVTSVNAGFIQLDAPYTPSANLSRALRITGGPDPLRGLACSPAGVTHRLLIELGDLSSPDRVLFRVTPRDATAGVGTAAESSGLREVQGSFGRGAPLGNGGDTGLGGGLFADIDGDGDEDLVFVNNTANSLEIIRQTEPGSFPGPAISVTDSLNMIGPVAVAAGDLDGDGDTDLCAASLGSNNLTVFFQQSPGVFQSPGLVLEDPANATDIVDVVLVDLDADGALDIATANNVSNTLTVFFQQSPGAFSSSPLVLSDASNLLGPRALAAADLDGDGDLDLASANQLSDNVTVFFQLTPGVFDATPLPLDRGSFGAFLALSLGDLDGDGLEDIVVAGLGAPSLTIFRQTSPGSFAVAPSAGAPAFANDVLTRDVDADGDLDVILSSSGTSRAEIFLNDGQGQLTPGFGIEDPNPRLGSLTFLSLAARDVDGDGHLDLALVNPNEKQPHLFLQSSIFGFSERPGQLTSSGNAGPQLLTHGDFDRDGLEDIVRVDSNLGNNATLNLQRQLFPGFGVLTSSPVSIDTLSLPRDLLAADLDGDGDQDLAVAVQNARSQVYRQQEDGTFAAAEVIPSPVSGAAINSAIAAGDIDGDGALDIVNVLGTVNSQRVVVQFQRNGGFGSDSRVITVSQGILSVRPDLALGDIDDDGDLDIVVSLDGEDRLLVLRRDPSESDGFQDPVSLSDAALDEPVGLVIADLDQDGRPDIASVNKKSQNVTVFLQDASAPGGFAAARIAGPPGLVIAAAESIAAADFDGDGAIDLAVSGRSDNRVFVLPQTAPGRFATSAALQLTNTTDRVSDLVAADFNGDGRPDIAAANDAGRTVELFFKD